MMSTDVREVAPGVQRFFKPLPSRFARSVGVERDVADRGYRDVSAEKSSRINKLLSSANDHEANSSDANG